MKKDIAPHPLGATLGPAAIGPRRKDPLLAAEIIRLLERHGVPWRQAVREAAGLMAQTVEEAEGWWAFEMAHEESPVDEEMIRLKHEECDREEFRASQRVSGEASRKYMAELSHSSASKELDAAINQVEYCNRVLLGFALRWNDVDYDQTATEAAYPMAKQEFDASITELRRLIEQEVMQGGK